jgi:hypothetical protein
MAYARMLSRVCITDEALDSDNMVSYYLWAVSGLTEADGKI